MKEASQSQNQATSVKLTQDQINTIKKDLGIDNDKHVPTTIVVTAVANDVARKLSIEGLGRIHAVAVR